MQIGKEPWERPYTYTRAPDEKIKRKKRERGCFYRLVGRFPRPRPGPACVFSTSLSMAHLEQHPEKRKKKKESVNMHPRRDERRYQT
jgi:hypothetical protein